MSKNKWSIASSDGAGGSVTAFTGSASRYKLTTGNKSRYLYWAGLGLGISVPGATASGGVATSKHWASAGDVYFSQHPHHKRYTSAESVFRGNGMILEIGINSDFLSIFGLKPLIEMLKKSNGINDYENQLSLQMLMFTTNSQITGLLTGTFLAEAGTILTELAINNRFNSFNTAAVAFSASTSTSVDTAGVSVTQGVWFLPWW